MFPAEEQSPIRSPFPVEGCTRVKRRRTYMVTLKRTRDARVTQLYKGTVISGKFCESSRYSLHETLCEFRQWSNTWETLLSASWVERFFYYGHLYLLCDWSRYSGVDTSPRWTYIASACSSLHVKNALLAPPTAMQNWPLHFWFNRSKTWCSVSNLKFRTR